MSLSFEHPHTGGRTVTASGTVTGDTIVGSRASELIYQATIAGKRRLSVDQLSRVLGSSTGEF